MPCCRVSTRRGLIPGPGQTAALSAAAVAARRADVGALRSAYAVGVSRLRLLLPAFVGDADSGAGLLGALAALDPDPIRVEVNALFDEAGHFLAGLGDVVTAAIEEIAKQLEELLLPLNPAGLFDLVTRVHQNRLIQVQAISPAALAEHVRLVFAAVRRQLEALDPGRLAEQVDAVRLGLDRGAGPAARRAAARPGAAAATCRTGWPTSARAGCWRRCRRRSARSPS